MGLLQTLIARSTHAEPSSTGITENVTAKPNDPAFKRVFRPDAYRPGIDNPVAALPVEIIRQLLEKTLPVYKPQDVKLPHETPSVDPRILNKLFGK